MKRTLSLLLVLVMVFAMVPNVFAAETDNSDVDFGGLLKIENYSPLAVNLNAGAEAPAVYVWTPAEDGRLSYNLNDSETTISITLTQGEATATSEAGVVSLDVVANKPVEIEVSEINGAAVEGLEIVGTFGHVHTEETIPGKAATCTETGLTEGTKCATCGETLVAQEEIPLADHAWGEPVRTEATTEADAFDTYTCSACGGTKVETIPGTQLAAFAITKQPTTIEEKLTGGDEVVFSVEATGAVSYRWSYSTGTTGWKWLEDGEGISGANTATLTLTAVANNAYNYTCVVYDKDGKTIRSQPATYRAAYKFEIVAQTEQVQYAHNNDVVSIVCRATGENIRYTWSRSLNGTSGWDYTIDTNSHVVYVKAKANIKYYYRCIVYNENNDLLRSKIFTIEVYPGPTVTEQTPETVEAKQGESLTFYVKTDKDAEEGMRYQWLYSTRSDGGWRVIQGATQQEYTFTALPNNKYYYICLVTDSHANKVKSAPIYYNCESELAVTDYTKEVVNVVAGQTVTFEITSTADDDATTIYQWFKSTRSDGGWSLIYNSDNFKSRSLTIKAEEGNKLYYMCRVKDKFGVYYKSPAMTYTAVAGMTMNTCSAATQTVDAGAEVTFFVDVNAAAGQEMHYQWSYSNNGTSGWSNISGTDAAELTMTAVANNSKYYRCIITDAYGNKLKSGSFTYTTN